MVNWIGLATPLVYLGTMVFLLYSFSTWYRRRKFNRSFSLAPWFDQHRARDIYFSLLHLEPKAGEAKVPESVLKAALLRRAVEDVHRILAIRNSKGALSTLLQRGSIGDELWQRFQRAEQELEDEIRDVVTEAHSFAHGWGDTIFQSANEMVMNQRVRKGIDDLQSHAAQDKEWWQKRRASIQEGFMKELDAASNEDAVLVEGGGPADAKQGGGKKKKKGKPGL